MSALAIQTRGITRSFKTIRALDGLDLTVPRGSIHGFLGRNGAGKTTSLKILLGMDRADCGSGAVLGYRIDNDAASVEMRKRVGFVSETKDLYPYMNAGQMIRFTRSFFPGWRADLEREYLKLFDLPLDRAVPELSRGMRTQLMLLLALARAPELLILDEPTEGLDPAMIESVLRTLVEAAARGTTVFFSSHQLSEVEQIADRVSIISQGRTVLEGSLDDVLHQHRRIQFVLDEASEETLRAVVGNGRLRQDGRLATVYTADDPEEIVEAARRHGARGIEVLPVSLKEIFLEYAR